AAVGVAYIAGDLPQGRLGVGYSVLHDLRGVPAAADADATLDLAEVDRVFTAVKDERGAGAAERRAPALRAPLARATAAGRELLPMRGMGELRQGALEGVVVEAVARAYGAAAADVRRAAMLAGALPPVAAALAADGPPALA